MDPALKTPVRSITQFFDNSSADHSTLILGGGAFSNSSPTYLLFESSAGNAQVTLNGGTVSGAAGAETLLTCRPRRRTAHSSSTGTVDGAVGGLLEFLDSATAGNATLIANTGAPGPRGGGGIYLIDDSTGGTARFEIFGIGKLDLSEHNLGACPSVPLRVMETFFSAAATWRQATTILARHFQV